MSILSRILNKQTWIQDLRKNKAAQTAVSMYAAKYIPDHIQQEMRITAATSQVPYFDVVCCNLSYEIAMIATSPVKLDVSGLWKSLIGLPATRVGCTSFGYWGGIADKAVGCNSAVLFARNLDWPDPDGLLKKHTSLAAYKARRKSAFWSLDQQLQDFQSLTFPGYAGVLTGFAPGRFAVSLNAVYNDAPITFGAAPSLLTRQALETCRSYAEAVKLLCTTPLVCGALFTVIDSNPDAGPNAGCVVERTPSSYAIRRAIPVGINDYMVCATNDYHEIDCDRAGSTSEIAATSCNRWLKVRDGLQEARRAGNLADDTMAGESIVKGILQSTQFGCTIHSTVFNTLRCTSMPWS